ncbi:gluconokinase [Sinomonas sp. ASV486]|uniref:gluconokinase n=1 Tax=Sinomonas sp. ASV486 TaxID=3051170 RepID=UPI0027DCB359|nr:gluconokinase [Sinomonas sp. ASV486]MDQ4489807.1 gluconokinase [Sinomonas sp. ASV486]
MTCTHVVVMGVAGSGKTTIAAALAPRLGWPLAEADDFHPQANIAKMASGRPLDDEDRWPWLSLIRSWMSERAREGQSTVLTCSALRRSYRDFLSKADGRVVFVHLDGSPELLQARMASRVGHFMPSTLLPSQLAALEPLSPDERARASLSLDLAKTPEHLVDAIVSSLRQAGVQAP